MPVILKGAIPLENACFFSLKTFECLQWTISRILENQVVNGTRFLYKQIDCRRIDVYILRKICLRV